MQLTLIKQTLPPLKPLAIEAAVHSFLTEIDPQGDPIGFFNQTIKGIHAAVYEGRGDFWLAVDEGQEIAAYGMGSKTVDIDDRLTYWLTQAWVAPKYRGTGFAKECWTIMRAQAKAYMCKHIIVVSAREDASYCRFLGAGWHKYASLLKEDLT